MALQYSNLAKYFDSRTYRPRRFLSFKAKKEANLSISENKLELFESKNIDQ